uniref:Protein WVD2-like 7 n=1 Tax=Noccaea caerulescens TaxID=107243 RepID=A0A1J3FVT0_NOCCA
MTATSSNVQVSVSFGKFENDDSLSWEKFSSFSPNKYLEEVEKCATPGSVAQKKAYFESHYKKIAERKAEIILDQEKQLERNASFRSSSVQNHRDTESENEDGSVTIESSACYGSNGQSASEGDKLVTSIASEVKETSINKPLQETVHYKECQSSVDARDDLNTLKLEKLEEIVQTEEKTELIVQVEEAKKREEVVCMEEEVNEDISSKDTFEKNETPMKETENKKDQNLDKKRDKNVQTNHTRGSFKPNQVTKKPVASRKTQSSNEKSMTKTTNKAASPVSRAPEFSAPRVSKPASAISSMSTSRSSVKKGNVSTLPRKKQTAPKTLHTSLNVSQPGSDPTSLATTRKSLIMERMGDKDIVRRAFKTFQKSFDQLKPSGDGQDTAPKQVPAKATSVSSLATTGQKENGRLAKSNGTEKKGSNSHRSSSSVSKSNGTAKKQEISRPGARTVERIRLQAKPKAEAINSKTRRQSLDPKAKSTQGALPKDSSDKVL